MEYVFSDKLKSLKPSAIREILKATACPGIIPFAAGNPCAEAFPVKELSEISKEIFEISPIEALQYGVTEGYEPLRETVFKMMKSAGTLKGDNDTVIITSGAQQVMDLAAKSLCNEGDTVLCESPSFIGSLNCFRANGCRLAGVPLESDGMDVQALENALKKERNVRFIYTIPNFQNPSGATMSLEKRKAVYELAEKYNVMIVEDNPYGDLRVEGEHVNSIKSLDRSGRVIYAGSFSKILSPGLRVGFAAADRDVIAKMTVCKQTEDVHTPVLSQMLVSKWLCERSPEKHIEKIRGIYRKKLSLMCDLIDEKLSEKFTYVRPEGGLFVWCALPKEIDMPYFCRSALEKGVAVVPGSAFLVNPNDKTGCIRLNFSTPSDEQIIKGITELSSLF